MLKEYDLRGKTAIVTGAAQGIGKGIALTLAVYLSSEASDMVTGQNIFIDGGLTGAV
jgi:hypothetical protein